MDIEAEVAHRLCELTGADATLDPVADHPEPYITVEQTGGGGGFLEPVQLDIDCWGSAGKGGRKPAKALAEKVKAAVPLLEDEIQDVFHPEVVNTYRMPDPDTRRARYVVQAQLWVCE